MYRFYISMQFTFSAIQFQVSFFSPKKQQESKHWKEVFGHSDDDDDDKEAVVNRVKKKRVLCGISPALPFENRSLCK